MIRHICVVTGSRADYGLLRPVLARIRDDDDLRLQVVATGMHLSPEFGSTAKEIVADGFVIDARVEMLLSADSSPAVVKSMGLGMIGFSDSLAALSPDLVIVLGDRFEILSAASAALVMGVPLVHLHGGELTEGAFDDAIRHSITKMSDLHFVATESYRKRVIQLGEQPDTVFLCGGLGVENIRNTSLLDQASLERSMGFRLGRRNLLVTFHPATLDTKSPTSQLQALLNSLDKLKETHLIFTMPNADPEGMTLMAMINDYVSDKSHAIAFTSLGYRRYLSCVALADGVVGNSSSGLLEVPSFGKGTINIGTRQRGREQATSVINCQPTVDGIDNALAKLYSKEFQLRLEQTENPYDRGEASKMIVETIKHYPLEVLSCKRFYDLDTGLEGLL